MKPITFFFQVSSPIHIFHVSERDLSQAGRLVGFGGIFLPSTFNFFYFIFFFISIPPLPRPFAVVGSEVRIDIDGQVFACVRAQIRHVLRALGRKMGSELEMPAR